MFEHGKGHDWRLRVRKGLPIYKCATPGCRASFRPKQKGHQFHGPFVCPGAKAA